MGLLIDGRWQDQWYDTRASGGRFVRSESQFRNWITPDGSVGPTGSAGYAASAGRYHLYVSLACPWAHRTLIMRKLKGLETLVSVDVVHPLMLAQGWSFARDFPQATGDSLYGADYLHQLYTRAQPDYSGRVTVPVLWDKQREAIVNNESAEIMRMFNSAFDALGAREGDYYPPELQAEIDELNGWIYDSVNNGVYKAGFATTQVAYDEAVEALFEALDRLEAQLRKRRFLLGNRVTEADWRLFTTLIRFDAVYVTHFKCDLKRLIDYPSLYAYLQDLYQVPGIAETVSMAHIRHHYYRSHRLINPTGIISAGPVDYLTAPHGREQLGPIILGHE